MKAIIVLAIFALGKRQFSDGLNLEWVRWVNGLDSASVSAKALNNTDDEASRPTVCTTCSPRISLSYKRCKKFKPISRARYGIGEILACTKRQLANRGDRRVNIRKCVGCVCRWYGKNHPKGVPRRYQKPSHQYCEEKVARTMRRG